MRPELLRLAADLSARGESFALATVIRRQAPSSAVVGDSAVITRSGDFHGWLGGSCTRPTAIREALQAIQSGRPRTIALSVNPESDVRPGVTPVLISCHSGGSVDVYIEPVLPAPRLLVFGISPAARAAVRLAKVLGYVVVVIDPEAEADQFPEADWVLPDLASTSGPRLPEGSSLGVFAFVATHGEHDEESLRVALSVDPAYIGVVASRKRMAQMREVLIAGGIRESQLDRVRSPAGLDIGAVSPEEIALSVLAEIVQFSRSQHGSESVDADAPVSSRSVAVDPVCLMEVDPLTAKHRADVGGQTFYFCCGGCRERFLAAPERYTGAASEGARG